MSQPSERRFQQGLLVAAVLGLGLGLVAAPGLRAQTAGKIEYPKSKKVDVTDDLHGQKVPDPYRWLEDEADTPEVRGWIEAQNKLTFGMLERIPERQAIRDRLTVLWNFERFGLPSKQGGRYFFSRNDGLQNQNVMYWTPSLDAEPKELLDPNKLSGDGTVALSGTDVSDDGKLLAYGLSTSGSDWQEWKVRDIETGKDLPDIVKWVKFSGASWTKDGKGFFYSRYDEPKQGAELSASNYFQKLYYHKLGTPQAEDELVYERKDEKEWGFGGYVTDDGNYLVITVWKGTERKNLIFFQELGDKKRNTVELVSKFEAEFDFIDNAGTVFYFRTDLDAPKYRIVAIDIASPERGKWKEVIAEGKYPLSSASLVGGRFVCSYLEDVKSAVRIHDMDGKFIRDVAMPTVGSAFGFGGKKDDPETFYMFTSFAYPASSYRYDVSNGESKLFKQPKVAFNPGEYETKQVFYTSKDGTRIPMFLSARKGMLKQDGATPTLLYAYGGFNASITPTFSVRNLQWMEMGGIYALANIRGGGEYGKEWHEGGKKLKKQNCFDDFIAAAEYLIKEKYTRSEKLAIMGGSNGGLLVGAVITQRPDLFGAAIPAVGVLDMLRFHKWTIGHAWVSDYGSPDNADEFKTLVAYSPYHNLKSGTNYPATLITTGDHDDRVFPAHSFKFAARLQETNAGPNPTLIRIQTKAGHGAGKPTAMLIEEATDMSAFLVKSLGMKADLPSVPKKEGKPDSTG